MVYRAFPNLAAVGSDPLGLRIPSLPSRKDKNLRHILGYPSRSRLEVWNVHSFHMHEPAAQSQDSQWTRELRQNPLRVRGHRQTLASRRALQRIDRSLTEETEFGNSGTFVIFRPKNVSRWHLPFQ